MSGYLQGQVWFRDVRGSERDVLLALADHADDDGTRIYPAMEYLAWKVGLSKRRTQQIVSSLREHGALIVVQESTRYEPTHYRMSLDALPEKPPYQGRNLRGAAECTSDAAGVKSTASRGETQASPESSEETSVQRAKARCTRAGGRESDGNSENDPDATRLCRLLADLMRKNDPKAKLPKDGSANRDRWVRDMRLLIKDRDGDVDEVEAVIRWCQDDEFEQSNVLSPHKLRERFSALFLKTQRADPMHELSSPANVVPMTGRAAVIDRANAWKKHYPAEQASGGES